MFPIFLFYSYEVAQAHANEISILLALLYFHCKLSGFIYELVRNNHRD